MCMVLGVGDFQTPGRCEEKRFELVDKEKYFQSKRAASNVYFQAAGGMRCCDLKLGTGEVTAQKGVLVCLHFEGRRLNGKIMESTWTTATTPPCIEAGHTPDFPALGEGVIGMRAGGRRELIIPPSMNRKGVEEIMTYTIELITVASAPDGPPGSGSGNVSNDSESAMLRFWQRLLGVK